MLDAVPEQPDALHLLATVARESGRGDLAIDLYRRLLRRHPAIPIAHNSLGNMLQDRGEWQEAIACYEAALAHDPRYASAYFNLGHALLLVNDLIRAEHFLRQAAALAPDDAQVRARFARALSEVGRQDEAMTETIRSLELDPDSADIQNDAGVVHSTAGDFDTAHEHYRTALALDPGYAKAALNLAKSKRFTGEHDEDEDRIRTAVGRGAADRETQRDLHLALGKIHDDRGEWDTAFAHYERANRPFSEAAMKQTDDWLAMMDRVRAVFDAGWFAARPPAPRPIPPPCSSSACRARAPRWSSSASPRIRRCTVPGSSAPSSGSPPRPRREPARKPIRCAPGGVDEGGEPRRRGAVVPGMRSRATRRAGRGARPALPRPSSRPCLRGGRVTDKLPANYLHLGFIATIVPGAKIIHCRRDPLDNAVSLYFTDFMAGHEYSNDLHAIGRQIRAMRVLMTHWETVLGERLLTVDYEALVADPESLTRLMVAHVALEWDDACLRPHEVARTVRTASVWQVRQPVYRRSAGRARHYERFLGPLRRGLGEAAGG